MPTASSKSTVDRTLKALADPTRRRVIELLRNEPLRAGDIAARLEMSAPATSRHLRVLHRSGLIEDVSIEEDARVRVFRLVPETLVELRDWLSDVETLWVAQLDSFKTYAERPRTRTARARQRGKR